MTMLPAASRILIAACVALLVVGCQGKGGAKGAASTGAAPVQNSDVGASQKGAPKKTDAQLAEEAAARQRAAEEAKRKAAAEEAARRAQAEQQPVVKPLPDATVAQKSLTDPASQLKDPNNPLAKRSVYYDFDSFTIREEFQPMIENHGKFLVENADMEIRIEGHCDERGSHEYNLALGQRRADAVKQALLLLGVPRNRIIETVSFGAEKPKALGHDEESWAENRRVDLVYIEVDAPR